MKLDEMKLKLEEGQQLTRAVGTYMYMYLCLYIHPLLCTYICIAGWVVTDYCWEGLFGKTRQSSMTLRLEQHPIVEMRGRLRSVKAGGQGNAPEGYSFIHHTM